MPATLELTRLDEAFRDDVLAGLGSATPAIPARWLYDQRGSELFDQITGLPEYYPTRTETALLHAIMPQVAAAVGPGAAVVEFGAGSLTKTPILLEAIAPSVYVPIDISGDFLRDAAAALAQRMPDLPIHPLEGNFSEDLDLSSVAGNGPRLGFFPGGTIGNFVPFSATDLLRHFRATLGVGAKLLIGFDRVKSPDRLVAAYDDAQGVTAAFNLNLLDRINRELEGDIPVAAFRHEARWNDRLSRIEMHLIATRDLAFHVAGHRFAFASGAGIHTENSHKYDVRSARLLLLGGGWTPTAEWTDPAEDFALILAEAQPERWAP